MYTYEVCIKHTDEQDQHENLHCLQSHFTESITIVKKI